MGKRALLTSNFPLQKCGKKYQSGEDRISQLPDEILLRILYDFTLKEATTISVLSSRWTYLWMFTSRLNFDADKVLDKIATELEPKLVEVERQKYIKWVNQVLKLHKSSMIEEFRIRFDLDMVSKDSIDKWLGFALARGVQRLELDLLEYGKRIRRSSKCYTFPSELLSKRSCGRHGFVGLKSLKALCLKCVNVSGEVLEFLLSYCHVLECLVVHGSGELVNLEVTGPSLMLKYLEICRCYDLKSIKISNVNLVSFKLSPSGMDVLLKNVPLLTEVSMQVGCLLPVGDAFSKLSCCLDHLEVLTLDIGAAKTYKEPLEFPELTTLKKLVLVTAAWSDTSFLGFINLIKASPYLEKFVLQQKWYNTVASGREIMKVTGSPHLHLKMMEFSGYEGRTSDLEFAMYFLENAVALEKIIIDTRDQLTSRVQLWTTDEIKEEDAARKRLAKQQFEGLVPPQVELVII